MDKKIRLMFAHFSVYFNFDATKLDPQILKAKNENEAEFNYIYYTQPPATAKISQLPQIQQDEIYRQLLLSCVKYNVAIDEIFGEVGKELGIPNITDIIE